MIARWVLTGFALVAWPAAGAPILEQPIDCTLGKTCYIQNYVDADPSPGAADFACGGLTYDGHKGTDFALPTLGEMAAGVAVRAAAKGVVAGTRDGMADGGYSKTTAASIKGRECGNGVAIDHGDGWISQYCHMKRGSIAVSSGQQITAGQNLGQVGFSGKTEFPHLHLSLRHNGVVIDPFAPSGSARNCAATPATTPVITPTDTLWKTPPAYVAGGLVRLGFDIAVPAFEAVKSGAAGRSSLPRDAPALVLFAMGFGSRKGDEVKIRITGPDGFAFEHSATLTKAQALYFRAAGKKRPGRTWPGGIYRGSVTLIRNAQPYDHASLDLHIQ